MTPQGAIITQEAIITLKKENLGDSEFMELAKQLGANALEKQIPKKVTHEATLYKCCTCPNCKNVVEEFTEFMGNRCRVTPAYCKYCGQALNWSDTE